MFLPQDSTYRDQSDFEEKRIDGRKKQDKRQAALSNKGKTAEMDEQRYWSPIALSATQALFDRICEKFSSWFFGCKNSN